MSSPRHISSSLGSSPTPVPHRLWPGPTPEEVDEETLVVSTTSPCDGVVVIRAIGEIDLLTSPGWRRMARAACRVLAGLRDDAAQAFDGPPLLVCDLTPIGFLGATALAALVDLEEYTEEVGVALTTVAGCHAARRALAATALDRRLHVVDRLGDALPVRGTRA